MSTQEVSQNQLESVQHALGLSATSRVSSRNYFVMDEYHYAMPDMRSLVSRGLMAQGKTPSFCSSD